MVDLYTQSLMPDNFGLTFILWTFGLAAFRGILDLMDED